MSMAMVSMDMDLVMATFTMVTGRGLLMLSPKLMPTMAMAMVLPMATTLWSLPSMASPTMLTLTPMAMDTTTMARGRLRLSPLLLPRLLLRPMLTTTTDTPLDTDTDTATMVMDTAMDTLTTDTMDTPVSMVDTTDTITNLLIFVKN